MRQVTELVILLLFSSYHYYSVQGYSFLPVFLLLGIVGSLGLDVLRLLKGSSRLKVLVLVLLFVLTLLFPELSFFLPAFLYSAYLATSVLSFLFFFFVFQADPVTIGLSLIALYLAHRYRESSKLSGDTKRRTYDMMEQMISLEKYNAKLLENEQKNAEIIRLEERNQIARSLHDALGHTISSSIMQLEALKLTEAQEKRKESLQILQDSLSNGMKEIRKELHGMYDTAFSLKRRLEELQYRTAEIQIHIQYELIEQPSFAAARDIYNIIREALTNVLKHTDASEFNIYLKEQGNNLILFLSDNGSKTPKNIKAGMGLSGMEETVSKYGGKLNYYYRSGFHIHIVLMDEKREEGRQKLL